MLKCWLKIKVSWQKFPIISIDCYKLLGEFNSHLGSRPDMGHKLCLGHICTAA